MSNIHMSSNQIKNVKRLNHVKDSKAFIEYSNNINDVYNSIEEYNPRKKRKALTVFDMIVDMINNKKVLCFHHTIPLPSA